METKIKQWLGKKVKVVIDRPIFSHHPEYSDCIYQVNYGYIPGTVSGDGEPIDAYVLGVESPITDFDGHVIAVIERIDDVEYKLVVAEKDFEKNEIEDLVNFQEKYFRSKIIT